MMISTEFVLCTITARAFSLLFGYFHGLAPLGNFQFAWRLCDEVAALVETSVNRFGLSFFAGKERMSADMTSSFLTGSQIVREVELILPFTLSRQDLYGVDDAVSLCVH